MGPTGLILGLRPANERRRYKVTPSLIGWVQTWSQIMIHGSGAKVHPMEFLTHSLLEDITSISKV